MIELVMGLMIWISTQTGWPVPEPPEIVYIESSQEMFLLSNDCHNEPNQPICSTYNPDHSNILGLYNNEIKTIFLEKDFWWASVRDQSILLHELVHHMQYTKNWEHYRKKCKGDIEKEAYDLQEKWLAIRGLELGPTIDLGPLMRHVLTQCDLI